MSLSLPARTEAASAARKALAALNGDLHLISEARLADAQLLVSELVTNAVRHADGEIVSVDAYAGAERLRVVVANAGGSFDPDASPRSADEPGGWGLRIVEVVADRWGIHHGGNGMQVWFEVDRPRSDTPLPIDEPAPPPPGL